MSDLIYRDAAIALGLEEDAYDYVDVYELAKLPSVDAIPVTWIHEYIDGILASADVLADIYAETIKKMLDQWGEEQN